MFRTLFFSTSLIAGLLAAGGTASSHTDRHHGSVDHYVLVPTTGGVDCETAKAILLHRGFDVYGTMRCGGNYHSFNARRRGFAYVVHVMSEQGAIMVRDRSK